MHDTLVRIGSFGIVPVVKIEDAAKAGALGKALAAGGLPVAEITFRTSAAPEAIRAMAAEAPEVLVGAGTVTSAAMARTALEAGARFIACPAWDDGVVDFCLGRGVPVLPGVSGPDGVQRGLAKGLEVLKFFPAEALGGLAMLDALAGPFDAMRFVPTGGIDSSNVGSYARKRQVLAVGGSWMVKPELLEAGDWAGVERLTREAALALHGFAFAHVGINGEGGESAPREAATLSGLFGLARRETSGSTVMAEAIELLKEPYLGAMGHLALRCNDVERALAYLASKGIGKLADTEKAEKGKIKSVYLDMSIGGFAVHLLRA